MPEPNPLTIRYFNRSETTRRFSIERLFSQVRQGLEGQAICQTVFAPYAGGNPLKVFVNAIHAWWHRGEINHVTGETHYLACFLPRHRTVLTIHDFVGIENRSGIRRQIIKWVWYGIPILRSQIVTVISEETKRRLFKHFPGTKPERVRVIPNCVGPEFSPDPTSNQLHEPAIVLQIGTGWNKNLENVAKACALAECSLRIIGKPNDSQLRLLKEHEVEFTFAYNITDQQIVEEYRNCDIVVFASKYEGFGLPILEAQASGKPVVTSDLAPMNEVAGKGVLFVDPEDVGQIKTAILNITSDAKLRNTLIQKGLANSDQYSIQKIAQQYLAVYQEIAERI